MIKIAQNPTFTSTVNVEIAGDNGKKIKTSFDIIYKRKGTSEIEDIHRRFALEDGDENQLTDSKLIPEIVAGWGNNVHDEDGNPLPFTEENLAALVDIYPVRPAIVRVFFESLSGAKAKN